MNREKLGCHMKKRMSEASATAGSYSAKVLQQHDAAFFLILLRVQDEFAVRRY